jgi:heat-inducible transcriptional repressor
MKMNTHYQVTRLAQRNLEILWHIIDIYLAIRAPVSSKRVTERLGFMRSPATLRNIMATLEQQGMLTSQHCSSGRIPTSSALKLYIQRLRETMRVQAYTEDALLLAFETQNTPLRPEDIIQTIASLCGCAGFFFIQSVHVPFIKYLDFVPITPGKALGVLVSQEDAVSSFCFRLPTSVTPAHFPMYHKYLNPHIVTGRTLTEIREYVEHQHGPEYLRECIRALDHVVTLNTTPTQHIIIRGQSQLIDALSGPSTLSTFQSLLQWLETGDALMRIVSKRHCESENLYVLFGREDETFDFEGFNLVFTSFSSHNTHGAIGAIGPFYMDYQKIIHIIEKSTKFMKEQAHDLF